MLGKIDLDQVKNADELRDVVRRIVNVMTDRFSFTSLAKRVVN